MAELLSRQTTRIAAGTKLNPGDQGGRIRLLTLNTPTTWTGALNDTMGTGVILPAGTRFKRGSVSNATGAASSTLSIGLRDPVTKTVIAATAIASAVPLTTAARAFADNGTFIADGVESPTTVPTEVYVTFTGAPPTANQQIRVEVEYVTD